MYRHGDSLRTNEALTRYALIDPLLATLGWNLSDPDEVIPEYRPTNGRREAVDYMLKRGSFKMIIESKALDVSLEKYENKLTNYANMFRESGIAANLFCLTNGDVWKIYESCKNVKKVVEFSISSNCSERCMDNINMLEIVDFKVNRNYSGKLSTARPARAI